MSGLTGLFVVCEQCGMVKAWNAGVSGACGLMSPGRVLQPAGCLGAHKDHEAPEYSCAVKGL